MKRWKEWPLPPPAPLMCPRLTCLLPFLFVTASLALDVVVTGSPQTTGNVWLTHEEMEALTATPRTVSHSPKPVRPQCPSPTPKSGTCPGFSVGTRMPFHLKLFQ